MLVGLGWVHPVGGGFPEHNVLNDGWELLVAAAALWASGCTPLLLLSRLSGSGTARKSLISI